MILQQKRRKRPQPFIIKDKYFHKAKKEGFRARSVFKLEEIQKTFELIHPQMKVCDIGAAPGSFMQFIKRIIKEGGLLIGIDIKKIDIIGGKNIYTLVHNIFEYDTLKPKIREILGSEEKFDVITSDIAPNTTGRKDIDQYASVELNIEILKFGDEFLKKGGNLLLKVFKGEDFSDLTKEIKKRFERFIEYKPLACRDRSFEEYVICINKKD
ncbi:RlmE family RNA methyltransferase [Candidatus Gracilibacteria bacterium]|nr:RlmE family RNA methyltransferase [Candidatus Gracilibacteria bacterium]NUJ99224.1 RlmE family RNA methyltransferase [Candidatus Gracilibacteria bacterium]